MKITKIDLLFSNPVEDGWRPLFCRIYTDVGIYGDGEVALSYGDTLNAAFGILQDLAPMLIGMDPLDHEVIWQKLYRHCFFALNGGPLTFGGISAFDIALWDIKGKAFNMPVYKLLGGKQRNSLRAYASQLQNDWGENRKPARTPQDYARVAEIAVQKGFDAIKINFLTFREDEGRYPETSQTAFLDPNYMETVEARIAAVRNAVGKKVDIILENHCYTDKLSAVQYGNMARKYGILYYEEPTTPHPDLLSYVYKETGIPVASGERIYSRWQYRQYFEQNAIQIIQPDIGTCGGITEVKKICDMAYLYETGVQIHVCGSPLVTAASLQLECAIPNFVIHEYNINTVMPKMVGLTKHDYQPVDGKFSIPDLPGIGNEIAEETFKNSEIVTIK
ncbi:mandelate racemase/muconate lactonizing enzyme family protein [Clostridium sp. P21]|uniref:Mandelate racemase/muconate lactonizing enzyme family protein n=1 Tax=Clostridium muellerianum TaxID=2716538 RepID=A0A7Y0EH49_9CLOT|nr:mandelate racemase/muconate lactonizing enzyme family protein [Clostridium muellerianum]NMM63380.1 mandelate racemase/muconate lactonizing enzyme family protein [Clostridium muellerianum]